MLTYQLYEKEKYPLLYFDVHEIPIELKVVMDKLHTKFPLVVRGGLAYVLNTSDTTYRLKDIDLAMDVRQKEEIYLEIQSDVDEIFLNKNTFGDDVLTLFWVQENGYYKIDILLVGKLPSAKRLYVKFMEKELYIMDLTTLWYNRICKIAEKVERGYTDEKVMLHYRVVRRLTANFLEKKHVNKKELQAIGKLLLQQKIEKSLTVLIDYLEEEQLRFYENQLNLILLQVEG